MDQIELHGRFIRLEPLSTTHVDGLTAASAADPSQYRWSLVPQGTEAVAQYVQTAIALRVQSVALPYATVRIADGAVVGSTRFFDLERWSWPVGHLRHGRNGPDVGEIGYTWLASSAIGTGINTEAKLLMLTYAFETLGMLRVCFHTDARNKRSQAAIERIGGKFEGILRAHRMATEAIPRDSSRYAIVAAEWPTTKRRLLECLAAHRS